MDEKQRQQIRMVLDAFLRRKKIIACSLLLSLTGGIAAYLLMPKSYTATSLLMYQRQKISQNQMTPDYQAQFTEIISTLGKQITSRTSLEGLIDRFDLYQELRKEKRVEDIIYGMQQSILIEPEAKGDIFHISFEGENPRQVMQVTNALAAMFIEENLRFREEWASENLSYINDELRIAKESLDEKEATMRDYKLKYYNEMSEQRAGNLARLDSLQTQSQHIQDSIQELERTKVLILEQINLRKELSVQFAGGENEGNGEYMGLGQARSQLAALQARYTDRHPDVVRLKMLIQKLEKNAPGPEEVLSGRFQDPQFEQFHLQLKKIEMDLAGLHAEAGRTRQQMAVIEGWIEAAPSREAEWAALTRDYNELKKHYEELVSRSLTAESTDSLEKQQRGSQFKIVDAAGLPDKPSKPVFLHFMLAAIVLGFGIGGGLSFLLETLDTSFKDADDLESYLGLPVTCSIPLLFTEKEKKQLEIKANLWTAGLTVAFLVIASGVVTLWYKDFIII